MTLPVLICGAGLASLLFAKALLRADIPFIIFERDASMHFRGQGYRLRLSDDGLEAIKSVLGPEDYERFYSKCGKTHSKGLTQFNAITGEEIVAGENLTSKTGITVGISRGDMRAHFMEGCEPFTQWSKVVKGYELTKSGVKAVFEDGTESEEGCLLVGGEGVHSTIAKQVSDGALKVYDTGARGIHGQAYTPAFKGLGGEGIFRIKDTQSCSGIFSVITNVRSSDMDDPNVQFGWTLLGSPGTVEAPDGNYSIIGEPAADLAKRMTSNWQARFRPLFEQMNVEEAAFWKVTCSNPDGVPEWKNESRVTVIGDAVHSMTPAGGLGANTAVQDSALLGKMVTEAGGWREGLTEEYEKEMRDYGGKAVHTSYNFAKQEFDLWELTKVI